MTLEPQKMNQTFDNRNLDAKFNLLAINHENSRTMLKGFSCITGESAKKLQEQQYLANLQKIQDSIRSNGSLESSMELPAINHRRSASLGATLSSTRSFSQANLAKSLKNSDPYSSQINLRNNSRRSKMSHSRSIKSTE